MDKEGTPEKTEKFAIEASEKGAKIVLFSEAFIPCSPRGLSFGAVVGNRTPGGRKDYALYYANSIDVPGPETPYGVMSGLICWENYMPLARAAVYGRNPSIYLAPTADQRDGWQCSMRRIAPEGCCFVLSCNQFATKDMYPSDLACFSDLEQQPEVVSRGGSAIIDPLGNYVADPLWDKEGILVADLDMGAVVEARYDFDVMGHYARPDVFTLLIDKEPRSGVEFSGDAGGWEEDDSCRG
jgi:nitrilase